MLFICNVLQIIVMYATWYKHFGIEDALLKSVLVFATIGYPESVARLVMAQIATNFILLTIFLSHLVGQVGRSKG
jgi:hypothetical protein